MVGKVDAGAGLLVFGACRKRERDLRRRHEGAPALEAIALVDDALGGGDAVIVLALVDQREGAARIHLRNADEADLGRQVGNGLERQARPAGDPGAHVQLGIVLEGEALLAQVGALALGHRQRREAPHRA